MSNAWHVVHMVGRSDRSVLFWLDRFRFEHYYPKLSTMMRVPRRRMSRYQRSAGVAVMRKMLVPMFPRYVFTRFDFEHDRWRDVFDIAGVNGLLFAHGLPVGVSDDLIRGLRMREIKGAIPGNLSAALAFGVGDTVRVKSGPLMGHTGQVVAIPDCSIQDVDVNTRLRITIDWFGRATPVNLHLDQIAALPVLVKTNGSQPP